MVFMHTWKKDVGRGSIFNISISVGEGAAPYLGINLLHSGNFPERTIGSSGSFLTVGQLQIALLSRAELLQPHKLEALLPL